MTTNLKHLALGALLAMAVIAGGCGDDNSPASVASALFDAKPKDVAKVCDTLSTGVADRDDLKAQLMHMPVDERQDFVESFRSNLGDAVKGAEGYGFAETRDLMLAIFDECKDRGM